MYSLDALAQFVIDSRNNLNKFVKANGIKMTKEDYKVADFFKGYLLHQILEAQKLEKEQNTNPLAVKP